MKVYTAGSAFLDIDSYGAIIAATELSNLLGEEAIAASSAVINESVTAEVKSWGGAISTTYSPSQDDTFVILDISDPDWFDPIVNHDLIVEVIDHHPGYEEFWKAKIGANARIEEVGAACTQVFEDWLRSGKLPEISELSARLLVTGILDNTLNFGAQITKQRDHDAYEALLPYANLPDDWPAKYFTDCQAGIEADLPKAIENDAKFGLQNLPDLVGQLLVWDGLKILREHQNAIRNKLESMSPDWCLNLVSLKDGKSYMLADDPKIQKQLAQLLQISDISSVMPTGRLWLRKEILKAALTRGA